MSGWKLEAEYIYPGGVKKQRFSTPDGKSFAWMHETLDGWVKGRGDAPHRLYRASGGDDGLIFCVEGEKDADTLAGLGYTAVSGENGAGPGKWLPEYTEELRERVVVVLADNDTVGREYGEECAQALDGVAGSVRLIHMSDLWPECLEHGDITDMVVQLGAKAAVNRLWERLRSAKPYAPTWPELRPFDSAPELPEFPVNCLPGVVRDFVGQLSESTQTPPEMAGILSLAVLSTAFQGRYKVQLGPDWQEPLCLYVAAVAPPGERKSRVFSELFRPIYSYEMWRREQQAPDIAMAKAQRTLLEKQLQAAQSLAAKGGKSNPETEQRVLDLAMELEECKVPAAFRLLVSDTTPEKLVDMMEAQGGKITVASAEGGVFDTMKGRYDNNAGFEIYLKGHAGDAVTVDRIGRPSNYIPDPRLSMALCIQPDVLGALMDNQTMRGRGLCGRFLYAVCRSKVGRRTVKPEPVSRVVRERYKEFVEDMLAGKAEGTVELSPEADAVFTQYREYVERKLGGDWEDMRDWGGKLCGAAARIAGLLHLSENQAGEPISQATMERAIEIARALESHAETAYGFMQADEGESTARYILKRIKAAGRDELSRSELCRLCRKLSPDELDSAAEELEERGYLRKTEGKTGPAGGRPGATYQINPAIF